MKVIVFGLGSFGMNLAVSLTETGNEVIGIDSVMEKVNLVKDKIAHSLCLDATNELAYAGLPLKDTDLAVVAIGEQEGAAIICTAILKKITDIKIISRAISPIHDTVLAAMGITNIVHPEQDAADRLTKQINFKTTLENYQLDDKFTISEVLVKKEFIGKTLKELDTINTYNLKLITIIRKTKKTNIVGRTSLVKATIGLVFPETILDENDILVVFGSNKDISRYCDC